MQPARARRGEAALLDKQVHQIVDTGWVLARDEVIEIIKERRQRLVRTMVVTLAPSGQPPIGIERDDDSGPILVAGHEYSHAVNLHFLDPFSD